MRTKECKARHFNFFCTLYLSCYYSAYFKNLHRFFFFTFIVLFIPACTTPSANFHNKANQYSFNSEIISTPYFSHTLYTNKFIDSNSTDILHIYLDGDGSPWFSRKSIATDPTSRNHMILELMSLDRTPAIFLGRPCYHRLSPSPNCHPKLWTSHRYSPIVIHSMKLALTQWLARHTNVNSMTFIGYSGGGTIASLLAPLFPQTKQLITFSANLDTDAWAKLHGYSPLSGSLNPTLQKKLPSHIKQLHIAGELDTNVPPSIIQSYISKEERSNILIFKNQAHCCWNVHWLTILDRIKSN